MKDPLEDGRDVTSRGASLSLVAFVAVLVGLVVFRPGTRDALAIIGGLVLLIMLHEAGHFVAAKRAGMKVTEFFLGFGPRLWSFRRGETEYGVKAIPLGGYVRIVGMSNLEEVDPADEARTYRQATYPRRLVVVLAGVAVNFLLAFVLIALALIGNGEAAGPSTTIQQVEAASAASEAGFRAGDRIVAVDDRRIGSWDELKRAIEERPGEPTIFVVQREGRRLEIEATPRERGGEGFLGVAPSQLVRDVGVVDAVPESVSAIGGIVGRTGETLADLFSPSGVSEYSKNFSSDAPEGGSSNRVISVIGIVDQGSQIVDGSIWRLFALLGTLNVAVALVNLIPLPPFDGGHAAIALFEWAASTVRRRPVRVDYRKVMPVTAVVLVLFLMLSLSAMFLDIRDAVGN